MMPELAKGCKLRSFGRLLIGGLCVDGFLLLIVKNAKSFSKRVGSQSVPLRPRIIIGNGFGHLTLLSRKRWLQSHF